MCDNNDNEDCKEQKIKHADDTTTNNEKEDAMEVCNEGDDDDDNADDDSPLTNGDNKNGEASKTTSDEAEAATTTGTTKEEGEKEPPSSSYKIPKEDDPLISLPSNIVREGDFVILSFGDGRQIFAHIVKNARGRSAPVKINRRSYGTANLIGLPYGTVLELGRNGLKALPKGEDVIPDASKALASFNANNNEENNDVNDEDNRDLVDDNKSQSMDQRKLEKLREKGTCGSKIVAALIENSSTFDAKTDYSKVKYITKKQIKYQPRCRMIRCTGRTVCNAMFLKDPRKIMKLREDTLAQILSYSNACAGRQVLVFENCLGVVTGALAQRMGGYGKILAVYTGQQTSHTDMIAKFNLSFAENNSIKWIHAGEIFGSKEEEDVDDSEEKEEGKEKIDQQLEDREQLIWPCPLQEHTRRYLEEEVRTEKELKEFLLKRAARFARKLTRHTDAEVKSWLTGDGGKKKKCDSLIIATKYDPTKTLLDLLPYLEPSCPFVIFFEFLEPLADCFREIQRQGLAINLHLMDVWMREYQVLPGRTHPNMNMSQSGGFLLTGVKLCPVHGKNELEEDVLKELLAKAPKRGRRTKKRQRDVVANDDDEGGKEKNVVGKKKSKDDGGGGN